MIENSLSGSAGWQIPWNSATTDSQGQIKGYASATSVNKGGNITFFVTVNPSQTFTVDIYRLGWYQGLGARLIQHIGPLNGSTQQTCPTNATTGMIECHWNPAYTLTTQTSWTSGIYLALLTNSQGLQNYIQFVVRDDTRVAALLYQQPVLTYQAYNDYPYDQATGKSLYDFNSYGAPTVGGTARAVKVSFDRPYMGDGLGRDWGFTVLNFEYPFIRWLEMNGYDVTYSTDIDTHANPTSLYNYSGILVVGHPEYWTLQMYNAFNSARDRGVNLGFFAADTNDRQVRLELSSSGVANRVVVFYGYANLDPTTDPTLTTVSWRDPQLNRPQQTLIGNMYTSQVLWRPQYDGYVSFVVQNANNWVYAGTGFKNGDSAAGIVGYETDRYYSQSPPPNAVTNTYTLLSNSPYVNNENGNPADYSNATVYQAPSGAWVFSAGTMGWGRGLDNWLGYNVVDTRIQLMTTNVLNAFVNPSVNFGINGSPATQTVVQGGGTSYGVTITSMGGFSGQVTLSLSGQPTGVSGGFSTNPATASSTLSITTSTTTPVGTYTLTITGVSGSLAHTATLTLVVNPLPNFTLSASPSSQTVTQGIGTSYGVTIGAIGGFTGQITLSLSGQPSGVSGSFSTNPATTTSTLSVTTSAATTPGTYVLTITGVSGNLTHATTVTLIVNVFVPPDFALTASPSSATVGQGVGTSYGITVTATGGFSGQVTLSLSGQPSGVSGSFSTNPATTTSTLSVSTSATTPAGTYTLTITGVSGSLTHTTTVGLVVSPPGVMFDNSVSSDFQFGVTSLTTKAFVVGTGANRVAMIMLSMITNNANNITVSLGGVNATLIAGADSGITASARNLIFCVINPSSGLQTAKASWTNSTGADLAVITVTGGDQTVGCNNGTFVSEVASGTTSSLAITSNPGDMTASVALTDGNWAAKPTNLALRWGVDGGSIGGNSGNPGIASTWTDQWGGQQHIIVGANFKAH